MATEKNPVWNFFVKVTDNADTARCKKCDRLLKIPTGTTTTLKRHLETRNHENELESYVELMARTNKKKPLLQTELNYTNLDLWPKNHPESVKLSKKLAEMIAMDYQPYSIVEDKGFINLMNCAAPKFKIPSRTTISRTLIPKLYEDKKNLLKATMENDVKDLITLSVTSDIWTSKNGQPYISLTCHYIDNTFNMKRYCLEISYFPGKLNVIKAYFIQRRANKLFL